MSKEHDLLVKLGQEFGLDILSSLQESPLIREKKQLLPYFFVKEKKVIPIEEKENTIVLAIHNTKTADTIAEIKSRLGKNIEEVLAPLAEINTAIEQCYHQKKQEASAFIEGLEEQSTRKHPSTQEGIEGYDLLDQSSLSPVIRLLNMVLLEGIQENASDIHFEPLENSLAIRYRIDGVLQMRHRPPKTLASELLTRIKVMAKMDITERRLPQDGRIKLSIGKRDIDFRASTIPVSYGERMVLRILDKGNVVLGLNALGMKAEYLTMFQNHIRQGQGIILVTGPTGSGKTTTLYSAIHEIASSQINVMTIEDPIEYKLPQVSQMGINPKIGLTFAKGLRHLLRQDPDVLMIGEIRDKETAEIAIQSALTGHLVFSTLHTNDAPSAITRLVDMGIEPYLLSSSILIVLAQRLIRKLCKHCKQKKPGTNEWMAVGCTLCGDSGYQGRVPIYELMPLSRKIKNLVLSTVDANTLKACAKTEGMSTLREEGLKVAKQGISSYEEVFRVTRGINEE